MNKELLELKCNGLFDIEGFIKMLSDKESSMKSDYARLLIIRILNDLAKKYGKQRGVLVRQVANMFSVDYMDVVGFFDASMI